MLQSWQRPDGSSKWNVEAGSVSPSGNAISVLAVQVTVAGSLIS
jgi:hypothetical protein